MGVSIAIFSYLALSYYISLYLSLDLSGSFVNGMRLRSTHNLPPAEASRRKRKVSGDTPDPGREASPPAPLSYEWMSERESMKAWLRSEMMCYTALIILLNILRGYNLMAVTSSAGTTTEGL